MCNLLPVILRANFDDPVDSAKDLVDRNYVLIMAPWALMWKQWLATHDNPHYNKIAETMIITKSWDHFRDLIKNGIMKNNTRMTLMTGYMPPLYISYGLWWKSKEIVDGFQGFAGYLTRKKWKHYEGHRYLL